MNLLSKFDYRPLERKPLNGVRHYVCPSTGTFLPSVTSILDKTADKTGLLEWRKRVGNAEADRISKESLALGTLMHTHLECFVESRERPGGTNLVRKQATMMADQIIKNGLVDVEEVWGSEVGLYFPGLYAGTTDLVGVYQGRQAILDFKTARKMKKREHIEDYFHQMAAYKLAHNELYGTDIKTGVIFMVDRDGNFGKFVIQDEEMETYCDKFLDRLQAYLFPSPIEKALATA